MHLNVRVTNNGEDAHEATLTCILPDGVEFTNVDALHPDVSSTGLYLCMWSPEAEINVGLSGRNLFAFVCYADPYKVIVKNMKMNSFPRINTL